MKKNIYLLTALMMLTTIFTSAQPGSLDSSFNGSGKKTKPAGKGYAVAIQPDKKILVAGSHNNKFLVARYKTNGTIDKSFGNNGKTAVDIGNSCIANAIALQQDGKIIAAGTGSEDFALARLNADGRPDSSFGINGQVTTDFLGEQDYITAVTIQPDNKILAIGTAYDENGESSQIALCRYNKNGALDNSFGDDGKVAIYAHHLYGFDEGAALVLQPNGKIVAIGYTYTFTAYDFALIRYKVNGRIDSSFGTNGITFTDFNDFDIATSAGVQLNGKIVVAGYSDFFNGAIDLARYSKNGILDSSFGTNGKVITVVRGYDDKAYGIAIQPDNKIVVAGYSSTTSGNDFLLIRYKANGKIDKSFGVNGIVITDFAVNDIARSVVLQPDGKIVAAGSSDGDFALARYIGGDALVNDPGTENISAIKTTDEHITTVIKVYPNPVQSVLNLEFGKASLLQKTLSVYDVNGKLLITRNSDGNTNVDVRSLANGTYLIKINDENGKELYSGKVIKQ